MQRHKAFISHTCICQMALFASCFLEEKFTFLKVMYFTDSTSLKVMYSQGKALERELHNEAPETKFMYRVMQR